MADNPIRIARRARQLTSFARLSGFTEIKMNRAGPNPTLEALGAHLVALEIPAQLIAALRMTRRIIGPPWWLE